jgi:Flp pilus assembly protein TadG
MRAFCVLIFSRHRFLPLISARAPAKEPMNFRRFIQCESGQTIVLTALSMIVMVGFLGLAVDVGHLRYEKRHLQLAADAAALASTLELENCPNSDVCSAMQTAATNSLVENGFTLSAVATNCATSSSSGLTLTINRPACALGASDPNAAKTNFVEVLVQETEETYFAKLLGFNNVHLQARAEAGHERLPCIYALDQTGAGAISILAAIGVNANCSIVDESSSPAALTCIVGAFLTAPQVSVTGGDAGLLCGFNSRPTLGAVTPTPADPLAYLPKPTVGSCGTSTGSPYYGSSQAVNLSLGGNVVFNPGVYCGGISITGGLFTNVTFNPGTYILKSGPGILGITSGGLNITATALSSVTGTGVTFYNVGPQGSISITAPATLGLSNFNLSAPTSGTYSGILFFQDPSNTSTGVFIASLLQGSKLEGAIYLPNASVSYGVSALSSAYDILVAKDINFNVAIASTFGSNYSGLANGSPLEQNGAVLVQ